MYVCNPLYNKDQALYVNLPHVLFALHMLTQRSTNRGTLCQLASCPLLPFVYFTHHSLQSLPLSPVPCCYSHVHTTLRYANPYVWCAGLGVLSAQTLEKTLPPSRMLCACLFAANLENISAMGNEFLTSFFSFFVQVVRPHQPSLPPACRTILKGSCIVCVFCAPRSGMP